MMKTHASAFGTGRAPVSNIVKTPLFRTAISALLAFAALSVHAADYNWTGGAGNCLFSDSGNWTNELGEAVAPANNTSTTFSFSFPVDVSGVLITNDVNGSIFAKSLVIERTDSGAAEIKFVSLPHVAGDASTNWADKEKYIFDFAGNSTFDVPADTTLILNTDMGRWVNNDVTKTGEGTVYAERDFSLFRKEEDGTLTFIPPKFRLPAELNYLWPVTEEESGIAIDLAAYGALDKGYYVVRRRIYLPEAGEDMTGFDRSWRTLP